MNKFSDIFVRCYSVVALDVTLTLFPLIESVLNTIPINIMVVMNMMNIIMTEATTILAEMIIDVITLSISFVKLPFCM